MKRYVYLIRRGNTDAVKIGVSSAVSVRVKALQTGHEEKLAVIRTWPGAAKTERWLHEHFADRRTVGEWFRFCPEMLVIECPIDDDGTMRPGRTPTRKKPDPLAAINAEIMLRARRYVKAAIAERGTDRASEELGITSRRLTAIDRREIDRLWAGEFEDMKAWYRGWLLRELAAVYERASGLMDELAFETIEHQTYQRRSEALRQAIARRASGDALDVRP